MLPKNGKKCYGYDSTKVRGNFVEANVLIHFNQGKWGYWWVATAYLDKICRRSIYYHLFRPWDVAGRTEAGDILLMLNFMRRLSGRLKSVFIEYYFKNQDKEGYYRLRGASLLLCMMGI